MARNQELRREQTERLFDLLKLKYDNRDLEIEGLDVLIVRAKVPMDKEGVTWVEKLLQNFY